MKPILKSTLVLLAAATLAACGAGGGSANNASTSIAGNVTKGPTSDATVCAFVLNTDGSKGAALGCTKSKADSSYSFSVSYSGDILLEATGGTYTDEATGVTTALSTPLQVVVNTAGQTRVAAQLTPLTALGVEQLKTTGIVNAANYKAALQTLLGTLKEKGVLPATASVDLTQDAPVVSGSSVNDYGNMLIGVSRLMGGGKVTLAQFLNPKQTSTSLTTLAQVANSRLNNAQAVLIATGAAIATRPTNSNLCSIDRDKAWSPVYRGFALYTNLPTASVSYLPWTEDGTGSTYNPATDAPIGGLCYSTQIQYLFYTPLPILATGNTVVNVAAISANLKTTLASTDIRCFTEAIGVVASDWPEPQLPPVSSALKLQQYFRLTTETATLPANANGGQICNPSGICSLILPIGGGPFGQQGGLCWTSEPRRTSAHVWKY